jgi:hypothetical protein
MREMADHGCENRGVSPTPAQQAQAARIAAEIAALGFALPGTLADRMTRCGYANCRCHADPPRLHGPYHQWTRKKNGKTATRILSDDQIDAPMSVNGLDDVFSASVSGFQRMVFWLGLLSADKTGRGHSGWRAGSY